MRPALFLMAVLLAGPARAEAETAPSIVMGVRTDAPPFAWRDERSGDNMGYLVDLCVDAVTRANHAIARQVEVTPAIREAFFAGQRPDIDLLCDPTTITLARLTEFGKVGLEFSPIVFVANGAYLENNPTFVAAPEEGADDKELGLLDASATPADCLPKLDGDGIRHLAAGFVRGTTAAAILPLAIRSGRLSLREDETVCPRLMETHWKAAEAFCEGTLRYYFGDQDILRSAIEITRERGVDCPEPKTPLARPLSYEPYALVVSDRMDGFREAFIRGLYAVFSAEMAANRFRSNFPDRAMSPYLETLFGINQIPEGEPAVGASSAANGATVRVQQTGSLDQPALDQ